jgi:hypothetical protein
VKTAIVVPGEFEFHGQVKPGDDEADSGFPRNPQVIANQKEIPMMEYRLSGVVACHVPGLPWLAQQRVASSAKTS